MSRLLEFCPHLKVELHRHEGAYYDTGWRAAVKAQPSIVSITSFNEWGEGTQVFQKKKTFPFILMKELGNQNIVPLQIEPAVPYRPTNISYRDYRSYRILLKRDKTNLQSQPPAS